MGFFQTDNVEIKHSNTGYCSNGDPCSEDGDCSGSCDDYELRLELELVNEDIASLDIVTKNTNASDDSLTIKFEGSGTLTMYGLKLDASNGPLELRMSGSAAVETQ